MRFLTPKGATFNRPKLGVVENLLVKLKLREINYELNANLIRTTKYTLFNFLPKNLFEQFHKIANIYFLLLVILQFVPAFGIDTAYMGVLPLLSILVATALKDGFEDYKRYKQDTFVNFQSTHMIQNKENVDHLKLNELDKLKQSQWKDVSVGNLIYIGQDKPIPADCLIVYTSDPAAICYVETKNLDGETNLKIYQAINNNLIEPWLNSNPVKIEYEDPNPNLYSFQGLISIDSTTENTLRLDYRHVLLRGSILRNTDYCIGLVLYSGADTKIMLNTRPTPTKRSKIDLQLNPLVAFNFLMIAVLCVITCIGYALTNQRIYLTIQGDLPIAIESTVYQLFYAFGASLILYQNIVPISVYISIEFVKIISAYYIHKDKDLIYTQNGTIIGGATPKSWTISDDLGQIEFVFSDKTGTLTQNVMVFKRCSINGVAYGLTNSVLQDYNTNINKTMDLLAHEMRDRMAAIIPFKQLPLSLPRNRLASNITTSTAASRHLPQFIDLSIVDHLKEQQLPQDIILKNHSDQINQFFLFLSICHTVLLHNGEYKAQSPDEAALVSTARDMGYSFNGTINNVTSVEHHLQTFTVPLLEVIEFSSTRKRMSVIVELDQIYLICKGADSIIYSRLAPNQQEMKNQTLQHLEMFANDGLRTLCIAYKILSKEEYEAFKAEMHEASITLENTDDLVEKVASKYENDLVLLGATAIEDKLQRGVPEAIEMIRLAGLKLWVLTGDKVETAITIGYSCRLITKEMNLVVIQANTKEELINQLDALAFTLTKKEPCCLAIDGHSLTLLYKHELQHRLTELGMQCQSVLCCRTSPRQKADVVQLIKATKRMSLAIGDGANDVSMIQEANIGIGIAGVEGMQAAMSSDFSIYQFRFIKKLLLVHGRWTYMRTSKLIVNFFYKNCVWVFCLFYFQFFCGFSTLFLFDYFYLLIYNVFLTLCPVLLLGVFDLDVNKEYSYKYPALYQQKYFSFNKFLIYLLDAAWASSIIFFGCMFIGMHGDTSYSAVGDSMDYFGALVSIPIIVTANMSVGLDIRMWNTWVTLGLVASAFSLFIVIPIYTGLSISGTAYGVGLLLYQQPSFYLISLIVVFLALLPKLVIKSWQSIFMPYDSDIVREVQIYEETPLLRTEEVVMEEVPMTIEPNTPENVVNNIAQQSSTLSRHLSTKHKRQSLVLNANTMRTESNTGFAFSQEKGVLKYLKHLKMFDSDPLPMIPDISITEDNRDAKSK